MLILCLCNPLFPSGEEVCGERTPLQGKILDLCLAGILHMASSQTGFKFQVDLY